jgi:ATP-dependent HslUV protease ATP-binding subunit HslU
MAIALPERTASAAGALTPREIVAELDKFVVGQAKAKRAVAIALRNRYRRQLLQPEMAEEVTPKNILMIGPTGVGKTEIARRLAKLAQAPFIKVEASKFTEVGYVGRDVESMVRDLVELAVELVRTERAEDVAEKARAAAEERVLDLLLPPTRVAGPSSDGAEVPQSRTRQRLRDDLRAGRLDDRVVEVEAPERQAPPFEVIAGSSPEQVSSSLKEMMGQLFRRGPTTRKLKVPDALTQLAADEQAALVDMESVGKAAVRRVEQGGIIFIDEIDKIASRDGGGGHGPDVSREGVQRDILPIVEGTTVSTKHGFVRTDHILFIAAGAFHVSKPSDLIPELQGRFPIRVELDALTRDDLERILTEPRGSLVKQYTALLGAEGVNVSFTDTAVSRIADFAARVNDQAENIGARRLHTVMERLLDELSFEAPERRETAVVIDEAYVERMLADVVTNEDLSRYIL